MLSTRDLKKYIYKEIGDKLGNINCSRLFFVDGNDSSIEGTYIFSKGGKYHILFTEKGKIRSDITTTDAREVLWNVLSLFVTDVIINYSISNKEKGKDFRRVFFAKEKEIYSLFGSDFEMRKAAEIEEILKKNPYNDEIE